MKVLLRNIILSVTCKIQSLKLIVKTNFDHQLFRKTGSTAPQNKIMFQYAQAGSSQFFPLGVGTISLQSENLYCQAAITQRTRDWAGDAARWSIVPHTVVATFGTN